MKQILSILLSMILLSCNGQDGKIFDDINLKNVTSLDDLEYMIDYEFNELEKLNEGVYIAIIEPTEEYYNKVKTNIESNKISFDVDSTAYSFVEWKSTPLKDKNTLGLFNYDSDLSKEDYRVLEEIKSNALDSDNFFCYIYETDNPDNLSLYILDTKSKKIKIYQTYF